ncbi:hypothetical protein V6N11_049914 [Hibiscus sabdariffa]|uniref:Sorting nexin C-terminal domain-containing protein n=1 Tax=Hibiscus sabdariffa TaxID=183260 RepID=A0ABR2T946_9ROSI
MASYLRTWSVNVDDAIHQFRGVSDGLKHKVVGLSSPRSEASSPVTDKMLSWNADEIAKDISRQCNLETVQSASDNEDGDKDGEHDYEDDRSYSQGHDSYLDNELNSKSLQPLVVERGRPSINLIFEKHYLGGKLEPVGQGGSPKLRISAISSHMEDPVGMPPEWTPPNVSVPLLNLVDKVFQLKRRGWLRRQVFWISKQIVQLVMEDAIDDWLLRQIYWLRREENIALGIRWIQDAEAKFSAVAQHLLINLPKSPVSSNCLFFCQLLWPGGTFFRTIGNIHNKFDNVHLNQTPTPSLNFSLFGGTNVSKSGSFEQRLEATRRASDIKKMLFDGPPATLISLIGYKQYRRCARDIYYFTQSTTCIKQLAYAILELLLVSVFPELRDLVTDLHAKKHMNVA